MSSQVAVIGGGVEGQAAARYWQRLGATVTIRDRAAGLEVPSGVQLVAGPHYLEDLDNYDLLVRSPGVKPSDIVSDVPVTSGVKEFFARCPARIIGVTGTKGKGTTSTLITKILEEAGKRVWLGGNIGVSPLDFLAKVKASDIVVLELSSFQLMDLDVSPHIAVCLMVVPEHMDWHRSMREYVAAKGNLFWHQQPGDVAIFNPRNDFSTQIASLSPGRKVPYLDRPGARIADDAIKIGDSRICAVDEVGLIGPHNLENICAAVTAAAEIIGDNAPAMRRAITGFKGLPHRLERIAEVGDVAYMNDSFSTVPETAIAAIKAFTEPKVIILGGSDKKSDYGELARAVRASNVRRVLLIGLMAPMIERALREAGYEQFETGGETMRQIVGRAQAAARAGDVVLLSPACASFDMFKSYKERGEAFRSAVMALSGRNA